MQKKPKPINPKHFFHLACSSLFYNVATLQVTANSCSPINTPLTVAAR